MKLVFEKKSRPAGRCYLPQGKDERHLQSLIPQNMRRESPLELPELSELELVRHYMALSDSQVGVDSTFYPLGSCTMKYNPKVAEEVARLPGFAQLHPFTPAESSQGMLEVLWESQQMLMEITGMDAMTLAPMAGAQGEWTGLLLVRAYHLDRGDARTEVLVPDSAHGTNPASAALAGFTVKTVPSNSDGEVDIDALKDAVGPQTAALMLTNPNTLGLFERNILEIAEILHSQGALLYYDGANLNALCGVSRPGDMGFDIVHMNLHKTFATPHGGGGPGAGPVGVKKAIAPFLPVPQVAKDTGTGAFFLQEDCPKTIGRTGAFAGNAGIVVRAYVYLKLLGGEGVRRVAQHAVLCARYLAKKLSPHYKLAYNGPCMHEFVTAPSAAVESKGVKTIHIAKCLIDEGFHPPTVYFPLIVHEAIMVEPTETETRGTLDAFAAAMVRIAERALNDPEYVKTAPHKAPVGRVDEVKAARELVLSFDLAQKG